jgi:Domain of Unknown Function with PDB structure (DUF3857)/Transglutaminase-like superfamily
MRIRTLTLLAVLAAGAAAADDVPSWLKELTAVNLPQYDAKVITVVLLNQEQTVVSESGKLTTTTRTAVKLLSTAAADTAFSEQYDTASSKIRDFRAWMITAPAKVVKYGKDEILDAACTENDIYNECRRRIVSASRHAQAGAIFAYESVVERQPFVPQLIFHYQNTSPVRLARFEVTAPPAWEVKSSSFNGAPAERPSIGGTYTWQMENLPPIELEPASPSPITLAPWTGVTLLGGKRPAPTWPEAARLLAELNEREAEPDEAIAQRAKALVLDAATVMDKIRAIGLFVQQINYVSIQVDIARGGGYRPHAAPLVFQRRYGDCKDKANLMRAMLRAIGIAAYPIAIFAGDRTHVTREWPSLGAFNHAISAIRVGPETNAPAILEHPVLGRLLLFDPTDPYTPPGYLPRHEQGSLALIGIAEGGGLVEAPAAPLPAASRERLVDAELAPDGSLAGSFVDKRTGEKLPQAVAEYRSRPKPDYTKAIERWVGLGVPGAATSDLEIADNHGAFVLKGRFKTTRYAQAPQTRMLIFRAAPLRHLDTPSFTAKTRRFPVVLDADALDETSRIKLPAGFRVEELPTALRLDSPFGKFEASWSLDGDALTFRRKVEIPAQTIEAARYSEVRKFLDSIAGAPDTPVVLLK